MAVAGSLLVTISKFVRRSFEAISPVGIFFTIFFFHQPFFNFALEKFQSVQFHKFWPSLRLKTLEVCRNRLTQRVHRKGVSLLAGNQTTDILEIFKRYILTDTDVLFSRSQLHHTYSHTTQLFCSLTSLPKVSKISWTQLLHNQ